MGQKVSVYLFDDLDGESEATGTISFGWDGKQYEIDLNAKNAEAFEKAVGKYLSHARQVRTSKTTGRRLHQQPTGADPKAVRAWAAANGIEVNKLGKVPEAIVEQYRQAGN